MDELVLECPIHLDGVPLKDPRAFRCGEFTIHASKSQFIDIPLHIQDTDSAKPASTPSSPVKYRTHIKRKHRIQVFLNPPSGLLTQTATQSTRRASDADINIALDDVDSTLERVSSLFRMSLIGLYRRSEQLQRQILAVNEDYDVSEVDNWALRVEHVDLIEQHAALKSNCANLKNQHNRTQRISDLPKKYEAVISDAQQWREQVPSSDGKRSSHVQTRWR
jgi:hypothetical protein